MPKMFSFYISVACYSRTGIKRVVNPHHAVLSDFCISVKQQQFQKVQDVRIVKWSLRWRRFYFFWLGVSSSFKNILLIANRSSSKLGENGEEMMISMHWHVLFHLCERDILVKKKKTNSDALYCMAKIVACICFELFQNRLSGKYGQAQGRNPSTLC